MINLALPGLKAAILKAFILESRQDGEKVHVTAANDWITVPVVKQFVRDGTITLNISPRASSDFYLTDQHINVTLRFGGQPVRLSIPFDSIRSMITYDVGGKPVGIWQVGSKDDIHVSMVNMNAAPEEVSTPVKERPKLSVVK